MIFSSSILIATPTRSEILPVTTSQDGEDGYYIDTDSITFDRNFVEASVKSYYRTPTRRGASLSIVRWKANCSYRSTMYIESAHYDINGTFLWSNRKPSGWGAVTLGSVGESIYNSMCNQFRR